jgi:hypothetical protein
MHATPGSTCLQPRTPSSDPLRSLLCTTPTMVCAADAHHLSKRQSSRSSRKLGCLSWHPGDKKESNKNKCTSDAADELHQQHGSKDYAGHVGAERNGSSSCCEQCHAIRGKLMPYLDNWPTLLEFVGELNLRHSYNNKCCNVQHNTLIFITSIIGQTSKIAVEQQSNSTLSQSQQYMQRHLAQI